MMTEMVASFLKEITSLKIYNLMGFGSSYAAAVRTKRRSKHFAKCRRIVNFFSDILFRCVGT